eukprot:73809_1
MILNQINPNQTSSYSSSSCNITLCKMIQRNNRDRITKYGISNIYYNIKDDTKIVILQLLDKIHCYFMHSFDFGLKFTKNEINCIYNIENKTEDNNNNNNNNNNNGNSNNTSTKPSRTSNATRYIITILVKYQKLNDTQLHQKERHEILNELLNINAVELIDNFNITIDESISNNFETIYQMILNQINPNQTSSYSSSSCNITLCKMIQRNNRDRITKYGISNIYYNIKDDTKIVILQLLDKIHCYFMHSFDFGLKFTKNEINCIYNIENKTEDNNNNNNN